MSGLFHRFFYVPKYGKISDQVMMARLVTMVVTVVLCLAAMGIAAYAYFSHDVASEKSVISSANFETTVKIQVDDQNGENVTVVTSNYQTHIAELKADTDYFITVKPTARSSAKTGFMIITAENCDVRYHTQQLGKDGAGNTESITFTIRPSADTVVTFLAHWGTSSYYGYAIDSEQYIRNNETVNLTVQTQSEPPVNGAAVLDNTEATTDTISPTDETTVPPATENMPPEATENTIPEATEFDEPAETEGTLPTDETTGTPATEAIA